MATKFCYILIRIFSSLLTLERLVVETDSEEENKPSASYSKVFPSLWATNTRRTRIYFKWAMRLLRGFSAVT